MKTISAAQQAVLDGSHKTVAWLMEFDFVDGVGNAAPAYLTIPGGQDIAWGGKTYLAAGAVGADEVVEQAALVASGLRVNISGVSQSNVAVALRATIRGRAFRLYFAVLDADYQVLASPVLEFEGRMDAPNIADNPDDSGLTSIIGIAVEGEIVDYARAKTRRFTDADQQGEYPGDLILQYAAKVVDSVVAWPNSSFWK